MALTQTLTTLNPNGGRYLLDPRGDILHTLPGKLAQTHFQTFEKALIVVVQCRKVLAWSTVFGYSLLVTSISIA